MLAPRGGWTTPGLAEEVQNPPPLDGARGQPFGRALLDPAELCCLLRSDAEEVLGLSWLPDTT